MSTILQLTPHDPLVARDGRPFGAGQGNRMRGLSWLLPSVVAGSFRTALVKATENVDFSGTMPTTLLEQLSVSGVFPVHDGELYLPAPNDCVWDETTKQIHRVQPIELGNSEGIDFQNGAEALWPVRLTKKQSEGDFKAKAAPAWWPVSDLAKWLVGETVTFNTRFLNAPETQMRDHVAIEAKRGVAAESLIFATANLPVTHLPRFRENKENEDELPFEKCYADIQLSARVSVEADALKQTAINFWHPLGGERRLVHWQQCQGAVRGWNCPESVAIKLKTATHIRMVLATPAIFANGWKPDLHNGPLKNFNLKLAGVSNGRWKAISGWSMTEPLGPKPIRRMVPAGSVYFFTCEQGVAEKLAGADRWLQSVCDNEQDQRDGFGLAVWGTWFPTNEDQQ